MRRLSCKHLSLMIISNEPHYFRFFNATTALLIIPNPRPITPPIRTPTSVSIQPPERYASLPPPAINPASAPSLPRRKETPHKTDRSLRTLPSRNTLARSDRSCVKDHVVLGFQRILRAVFEFGQLPHDAVPGLGAFAPHLLHVGHLGVFQIILGLLLRKFSNLIHRFTGETHDGLPPCFLNISMRPLRKSHLARNCASSSIPRSLSVQNLRGGPISEGVW